MEWWIILFFAAAFVYAMVGHGGASAYLAIMSLLNFSTNVLRPTALVLNLFVSLISFIAFARAGYFKWKLFWPFALTSIPMAWYGGSLSIDEHGFKTILGVFLLIATVRMMLHRSAVNAETRPVNVPLALLIGALLGFLAGLIGIGGGIILSPVILLLGWADAKATAATSSLFIFVNSLAGLLGMTGQLHVHTGIWWMVGAVVLGGLVGGHLGSNKYSVQRVRAVLAVVLLAAAVKLLLMP